MTNDKNLGLELDRTLPFEGGETHIFKCGCTYGHNYRRIGMGKNCENHNSATLIDHFNISEIPEESLDPVLVMVEVDSDFIWGQINVGTDDMSEYDPLITKTLRDINLFPILRYDREFELDESLEDHTKIFMIKTDKIIWVHTKKVKAISLAKYDKIITREQLIKEKEEEEGDIHKRIYKVRINFKDFQKIDNALLEGLSKQLRNEHKGNAKDIKRTLNKVRKQMKSPDHMPVNLVEY